MRARSPLARGTAQARVARIERPRAARRGTIALVLFASCTLLLAWTPEARAASYVPISGAGSTWSQNALDQWIRNVAQYGMKVNYAGTGSSDGRNQFRNGTVDFAVSEIPYGLTDGGVVDFPPQRKYAYMPIVAGGTAFMYNLKIGNTRVTNLRLSGEVITKLFTGAITMWNDPAIKADNPGLNLPARKVIPVVRSDGSGTTAQFTTWMSKEHASLWNAYCAKAGRPTPCGVTSVYPVLPGIGMTAQSGSLGVSGYVKQAQSEGAITYVEYSYALNTNSPVAKVLNAAGYYVEPTASNVAVGLLGAVIQDDNPNAADYLTQELTGVYRNKDRRAYPLSSYSYMVLPTAAEGTFNTNKGKTLGDFSYYFLCEGQQQAEVLGYSPLPINLVQAGLQQVRRIPGVEAQQIDIAKCNNPTFSSNGTNTLATKAPQPQECDKKGATQCATGTGGNKATTPTQTGGSSNTGGSGGGGPGGGSNTGTGANTGTGTNTGTTGGEVPGAGETPGLTGDEVIDPDTGEVLGSDEVGVASDVVAIPVSTAVQGWTLDNTLMVIAGALLVAVAFLPPLIAEGLARRRRM